MNKHLNSTGSTKPLVAAILVALLAAGVLTLFLFDRQPASQSLFPGERARVLLTHYENRTGEPLLDDSLDIAFRTGLGQSSSIDMLPRSLIEQTLIEMDRDPKEPLTEELALELARQLQAHAVVVGTIVQVGTSYVLSVRILDPQPGAVLAMVAETADSQGAILSALQSAVVDTREYLR